MKKIFTSAVINSAIRSMFFATFLFLVAFGVRGNLEGSSLPQEGAFPVFRSTVLSGATLEGAPAVSAQSACLISLDTGELLFDKGASQVRPIASTTKIMTAIIVLESCPPDRIITVSDRVREAYGSSIYLSPGEKLSCEELLYGLLLESGNDAAIALAEGVAGSVEAFVELMNEKARLLGLEHTTYKNPHGLSAEGHVSSAYDLARLTAYALENPEFEKICSSVTYSTSTGRQFVNHNKLLRTYPGAVGVKTGYTEAAGRCLVSAARREDSGFICVTLGDRDDWRDHKALLDCAFGQFVGRSYFDKGQTVLTLNGRQYTCPEKASLLFRKNAEKGGKRSLTLTLRSEDS